MSSRPTARPNPRAYIYTDNFGAEVYRKVRHEQPKRFVWEFLNDAGRWTPGLNGGPRYLYRLPELIGSPDPVWLPEGEKDVESLCALGLTATTSGGANDPWLPEFDRYLAGRDVVILLDDDGPGWNRGNVLAEKLRLVAKSLRVVSFTGTGLQEHGDVTDWLEAGHTREELEVLADATPVVDRGEDYSVGVDSTQTKAATPSSTADMSDKVLDGRLGEIYLRRMARFPIAYAWPALVTVAGALVGRQGSSPLRANLFCGLVGPVDSGKSQAIECAIGALGVEKPRLQNVMSGSAEGLLAKLSDADGAARLVSPDELGHLLSKSHIENASFPFVLNRAYYQTNFEQTSGRGKVIQFNCSLSFIGGVVDADFGHLFDFATVGGLHDRFIFGQCPDGFQFVYRPLEDFSEAFDTPLAVAVDREVWEAKDEWVRTIPNLSGRCAEHALRVAGICAAFDGSATLRVCDLGPARAFAENQARVRHILRPNPGENPDAKCSFAIITALERDAPDGQWVNRRAFYRRIHAERHGAGVFNRALNNLQANGEVELAPKAMDLRLLP